MILSSTLYWRYRTISSRTIVLLMTSCRQHSTARSKRDGTHAETRFGLSVKRSSPFKSAGVSIQSTTGSRGVRISGQQLYRPCSDVQSKAAGYPLHSHLSPSLPLPSVSVCRQVPNALYLQDILNLSVVLLQTRVLILPTRAQNLPATFCFKILSLFFFPTFFLLLETFFLIA